MKKLISSILSVAMLLTTSVSAQAASVTPEVSSELVDIHGYACYERDGQFYTMLDGDECLVIDLDEVFADAVEEDVSVQGIISPGYLDPPEGWQNSQLHLAMPDTMYTYTCDITNGDYYSPIEQMIYYHDFYRIEMRTDQFFSNTYKAEFCFYVPRFGWYYDREYTLVFSKSTPLHIIALSSIDLAIDGYAMKIKSEGSTGEKKFQYKIGYYYGEN